MVSIMPSLIDLNPTACSRRYSMTSAVVCRTHVPNAGVTSRA